MKQASTRNLFFDALHDRTDSPPYLRCSEELLRSREGAQKGNPESYLLFALAMYHIFLRIDRECKLIFHRWYADGSLLIGKISEVKKALDIISEEGETIKFILHLTKKVA